MSGCDSVIITNLTVSQAVRHTQNPAICQGGSVTVSTHTYSSTGVYIDTIVGGAVGGCDSIITTDLTIIQPSIYTQNPALCTGHTVTVNGHTYGVQGTYRDTIVNGASSGCDSIIVTNLSISPSVTHSQSPILCPGGSISAGIHTYGTTGTYRDTIANGSVGGCDSIVITNLTVLTPDSFIQRPVICYGGSVTVGASIYSVSGTYSNVLTAADIHGCDSTVVTYLTILPADTFTQVFTLCPGGSVKVGSNTYSSSGTYSAILTAGDIHGCDSTVITKLTIRPQAIFNHDVTICSDQSITVGTHTYTLPGLYRDTLYGRAVGGCDSIINTTLNVNPVGAFTQSPTFCMGGSITVGSNTYTSSGNHIDTLHNASVNGCDSIVTTHLTVLQPGLLSQTFNICQGQSVIVNGITYSSNGTYRDTIVNGAASGCDSIITTVLNVHPYPIVNLGPAIAQCGGSIQVDAGNAGSTYRWSDGTTTEIDTVSTSGLYYVTVTSAFGCADSSGNILIYIKPAPSVNLGADITTCQDSVTLNAGNIGSSFLWSTGATSQTLTVSGSGSYSVIVTDTASKCTGYDTVSVNFNKAQAASLGPDTSLCGGTLTLTAGNPSLTYIWSDQSTSNTLVVSRTGQYSVTVTYPSTCTATASVFVTIGTKPNLGPDITDSVCELSTVDLYSYFPGTGLTLTFSTPTPAAVGPGTYTVYGTNITTGCSDTAVVNILSRQAPNAGPDRTDSICPGYTYDLNNLYPNQGYGTYTWVNTFTPGAVAPGTYILAVGNGGGCIDTAVATIISSQKPNLGGDKTDSICRGSTYDLTALFPNNGYANYVWINVADPTAVSQGTYQLVVTNSGGCTDTALATITYRAQPIVTLGISPNVCSGQGAFPLTGGAPAGGTYYINNIAATTFDPGVLIAGPQYVSYVYTNTSGCTDSATTVITIYSRPVIIDTFDFAGYCAGPAAQAIDIGPYFSPPGGVFSGPGVFNGDQFIAYAQGAYPITYIYTDPHGCKDTAYKSLTASAPFEFLLLDPNKKPSICAGESVTFTALVDNPFAVTYQFFVNGVAVTSASSTDVYTTDSLQPGDIVSVVADNPCTHMATNSTLIITPAPVANAGRDTTINSGQLLVLNGSGTGGAGNLSFNWTPGTDLNFSNVDRPTFNSAYDTGSVSFILRVTDANGCWDTASVTVYIKAVSDIVFQNFMSPNGDGSNDAFVLDPKLDLTGAEIVIKTRWGQNVYVSNNFNGTWDGHDMSGALVPDGTYYFFLKMPALSSKTYTGFITVIQ